MAATTPISKRAGVLLAAGFVVFGSAAWAELGPPVSSDKKLIAWAADVVQPAYLKQFVGDLERQFPIDGLIITVDADDHVREKIGLGSAGRNLYWFGGKAFKPGDFTKAIADLKATRFTRFTDNFMGFNAGGDIRGLGVPDWFSDDWSRVSGNAAAAAHVAKEGGLKGLVIDTEAYASGGPQGPWRNPFFYQQYSDSYNGKPPHTMAECVEQVRKRGKEFGQAVSSVYPQITLMFLHQTGYTGEAAYVLLAPFVDGIIEGCGDRATIIDGGEPAYLMMTRDAFVGLRKKVTGLGHTASRIPQLRVRRLRQAFGIWADYSPQGSGGWHTDPNEWGKNHKSPKRLEHTLYNALTKSDRYVWLFVIHPHYWWNPHLRTPEHVQDQMQYSPGWRCPLCPHAEIPQAYIDALRNCRKPHDLGWRPATPPKRFVYLDDAVMVKGTDLMGDKPNLLANGGFEAWSAGDRNVPDGWDCGGVIWREDRIVKTGTHAAGVTTTLPQHHFYVSQVFATEQLAGETLTFGAWFKAEFMDVGAIEFVYDDGRTWHLLKHLIYDGKGEWQFLQGTCTVPQDAKGRIRFLLSINIPYVAVDDQSQQ